MTQNAQKLSTNIRTLLALGMPLVGSSVAQFLIHMTDTIMLGWYNVTALAAATVATSIWFVIFIVGAGFGHAVMPMVAAAVAEGDEVRTRRVTRMALWLSLAYGLLAILAMWWSEALLLAMGQEADVATLGQQYLRIAAFGVFPALGANVLRSYLSAQHLTSVMFWVTIASGVMNAVVNYALIFGNWGAPELGIRGAAIASVILQVVTLIVLSGYAEWKLPHVHLFQRIWKSDWDALWQVVRLGLPIGMTSLAEGGLFAASSVMMGWLGKLELAAHGIALQLTALMFMFHIGISQAATIRAGGALGRKSEAELRMISKAALIVSLTFSALAVALFLAVPVPLISAFLDPLEPARDTIIMIGVTLLSLAALFQFVDATQVIALSLLRGVQDTTVPMWAAVISYWVIGLPSSYVMAFTLGWGYVGLWLGLTVGLGIASVLLMWRFWGRSVRITPAS